MIARLGPLAYREFRLLFLGRTVSFLGSALAPVAVAFAVLEDGTASDLGLVLASSSVFQIVFILAGGVISDRLPRRAVMVWSNVFSGLSQAVFAVLVIAGDPALWQLMAVSAFRGVVSAFFFPASQGIVPQTVPPTVLQQANAVLRLSTNACAILGAAAGGILVATVGAGPALVADAVSYVLAAGFLAALRITLPDRGGTPSFVRELREGWGEFISRRWLWVVVAAFGFLNAAYAGAYNVLGPALAKAELGGAAAWGFILTATGAGLIAGGLIGLRVRPRRALLLGCACMALEVAPLLLLALPASTVAIAAAAFAAGVGVELFGIYWDLSLQQHVPEHVLSRVSSYDALGSWVLMPIGYAVVGPVAELVGVRETLLGCAALVAAATLWMVLTPEIRRLERRDGPVEPPEIAPPADGGAAVAPTSSTRRP